MTTIAELPPALTVGSNDLLPLSQAGLTYSVTVAQLNANLQPLINVATGDLLGRQSIGAGEPEPIAVGPGLSLSNGAVFANGGDHAGFALQATMSLSDEVVINAANMPGLLPVTALRSLFTAGAGINIDENGVIGVTVSAISGPAGPQGVAGPPGNSGPAGPAGPTGPGLLAPAAGNSSSSIGASDYVAIWQNGATAWMPYGQFLGGQTIDQLPAAGPAADSDEILVAQGSTSLSVQGFGAIWTYVQAKLPSYKDAVIELNSDTVLDSTTHNNRILVASAAMTLSANFANMGPGFSCALINLAAGSVTMGTGISSGSGTTSLPPGGSTTLYGLSYSGGSLVWWSGITPNAPTITIGTISSPAPNTAFTVSGGIFNDAPTSLDYSTNNGVSWVPAPSPVISANAFSFTMPGLAAGTYSLRVRDHTNPAILGVSNSFTIVAPAVTIGSLPGVTPVNAVLTVMGTVYPGNAAVRIGLSASNVTPPATWTNASVNSGVWKGTLTPNAAGNFYVWAEQTSATAVQAISGAVDAVAATLTVAAPATGTAGSGLVVSGTVSPIADTVNVQLSLQNANAPTSGWTAATNAGGNFSATLTPGTAATYYAWAQDVATGLSAVSAAITVAGTPAVTLGFNNPGGSYVHGVGTIPLNGAISPPQNAAIQVALSTTSATPPTTVWQAASVIYNNALWAVYYPTPAIAGTYFVWVETVGGGGLAVSGFGISVT